jgi:hypothetical protein
VPQVGRRALLELLCVDMTETARAQKLGVARSTYYEQLNRLRDEGILLPKGYLAEGMRRRGRLTCWEGWALQSVVLEVWEKSAPAEISITIRWTLIQETISFITAPLPRWATRDTYKYTQNWNLPRNSIEMLTIAIAESIKAEALIIPEEM